MNTSRITFNEHEISYPVTKITIYALDIKEGLRQTMIFRAVKIECSI